MKKVYITTVLTAALAVAAMFALHVLLLQGSSQGRSIKVGIIYIGDASTSYTENFLRAMDNIEHLYADSVEIVPKYNIPEGSEVPMFQELVDAGCDLIFSTSYGYGDTAKEYAQNYPDIEICQASRDNANTEPVLENYHTFMGEIYQGRYISGVVAGMKLEELIEDGQIDAGQAKVGYVGAFPIAEVISGYTAFLLGVRSVVPEAVMEVIYTGTWSSYTLEKEAADRLIDDGCVIISHHSDTKGSAIACEESGSSLPVYHVSYNQNMSDVAPSTAITGCRINWEKYMSEAVGAVLNGKKIEKCVGGNINGNDAGAGFDEGWVEMLEINKVTAAEGTNEAVEELIGQFREGKIQVFQGDYIGVDPFDETDVYDLSNGYIENESSSAPSFHYVLQDVITVIE